MTPTHTLVYPYKVDTKGHLFCWHCIGFGHGGETRQAKHPPTIGLGRCFGCHRKPAQFPTSTPQD